MAIGIGVIVLVVIVLWFVGSYYEEEALERMAAMRGPIQKLAKQLAAVPMSQRGDDFAAEYMALMNCLAASERNEASGRYILAEEGLRYAFRRVNSMAVQYGLEPLSKEAIQPGSDA